jgi:hypothetical protein
MRGPAVRKQGSSWVDPDCVASCVAGRSRRHVFRRVDGSGWSQRGASSFFFGNDVHEDVSQAQIYP